MTEGVARSRVVIADLPLDDRPRERMGRQGAQALSDIELLAILVSPGRRGKSAIDLARNALHDGLHGLVRKDWNPTRSIGDLGATAVARIGAALELGRRIAALNVNLGDEVRDAASLGAALVTRYAHHVQERLGAIYLDSRSRILREREIYVGTLTSATVSTRDIFRLALDANAASVVVFHNHPSGDPTPSAEDLQFTKKVSAAGASIGVDVVDHLILATNGYCSLKQRGFM